MRRLALAGVLAAAMAASAPAHAEEREPSAGDFATARTALREGLALREKGDLDASLMRLTTAFDLVPTPVTGFELGKAYMMTGKILQAHELFKKVLRMPPSMEESDRSRVAREESERLAAELGPRIPSVLLEVTLPAGATATVHIDDEEIALTGSETRRSVDPGPHEIVAKAGDGPEERVHVEVAESEVKKVELAPKWVPPKEPMKTESGQVVVVKQTTSVLTFIGFAGASAGLALTASAAYVFASQSSDLEEKCGERFCPDTLQRDVQIRNAWGVVTVIGAASTIGFLAAGIIGVTNPKKERVVVGVQPVIGPGGAGLTGRF